MNAKEKMERIEYLEKESTRNFFAINDLITGDVHWIKHRGNKVGVVRPDSASGGLAIIWNKTCGYATVRYIDEWVNEVQKRSPPPLSDSEGYEDWLNWFNLASLTQSYRNDIVNKNSMSREVENA